MPITQDRFLAVIDGAARIIAYQRELQNRINYQLADDISEINAAIAHAANLGETRYVDALNLAKNRVMSIRDSLLTITLDLGEYQAVILAEQKHFARVKGRNERNAYHTAQRRERNANDDGRTIRHQTPTPTFSELNPPPPDTSVEPVLDARAAAHVAELMSNAHAETADFTQTAEYKAFQEAMRKQRIAAGEIPPGPNDRPHAHALGSTVETQQVQPTQWTVGADGVRRELPTDADLNAPPKTSDGNLL